MVRNEKRLYFDLSTFLIPPKKYKVVCEREISTLLKYVQLCITSPCTWTSGSHRSGWDLLRTETICCSSTMPVCSWQRQEISTFCLLFLENVTWWHYIFHAFAAWCLYKIPYDSSEVFRIRPAVCLWIAITEVQLCLRNALSLFSLENFNVIGLQPSCFLSRLPLTCSSISVSQRLWFRWSYVHVWAEFSCFKLSGSSTSCSSDWSRVNGCSCFWFPVISCCLFAEKVWKFRFWFISKFERKFIKIRMCEIGEYVLKVYHKTSQNVINLHFQTTNKTCKQQEASKTAFLHFQPLKNTQNCSALKYRGWLINS